MAQGCPALCINIAEVSSDMSYFYALKNNKIRTPAWRDLHVLYDYCNNHAIISKKLPLEVTLNLYTYRNAFYKYGKQKFWSYIDKR